MIRIRVTRIQKMNDMQQRVIDNIRLEARKLLRQGIPMPDRDPRWSDLKVKILVEERELYEKEIEAKHMADYETMNDNLKRSYEQSNNGVPYDEWLEKAKRLYKIDGSTVTSIARGLEHAESVDTGSPWLAKKRVLKLITWKYRDHFQRGHNFMYDPDKESR